MNPLANVNNGECPLVGLRPEFEVDKAFDACVFDTTLDALADQYAAGSKILGFAFGVRDRHININSPIACPVRLKLETQSRDRLWQLFRDTLESFSYLLFLID